jgi:hypothetical protein
MKEWVIIGVLTLGPALYMLGGKIGKWLRRIILPLILGLGCLLLGIVW